MKYDLKILQPFRNINVSYYHRSCYEILLAVIFEVRAIKHAANFTFLAQMLHDSATKLAMTLCLFGY